MITSASIGNYSYNQQPGDGKQGICLVSGES